MTGKIYMTSKKGRKETMYVGTHGAFGIIRKRKSKGKETVTEHGNKFYAGGRTK